jgi:hypothetical protein
MFVVSAGTPVKVHDNSRGSYGYSTEDRVTKRELSFTLEDVRIDPVGQVGRSRGGVTIGSAWAEAGWYGFGYEDGPCGHKGWMVLVPASAVRVI